MKIGILTQPLHTNYGGLLQNYALQSVLKKMGHDPWTINREIITPFYIIIGSIVKRLFLNLTGKKVKVRSWMTHTEKDIISKHTKRFIDENIQLTRPIKTANQMVTANRRGDFYAYVVGSDQVWRPLYVPNLPELFLNFADDRSSAKKIAYAASFGVDQWEFTERQTKQCSMLAKRFDAISVREDSGVELCKDYLGVEASHVLDPTLLVEKEEYVGLVERKKLTKSKGNLFVYLLDKDERKLNLVSSISTELALKPFEVMPEIKPEVAFGEVINLDLAKCVYPSVEEWIQAFIDAKYVVTDSFHGTVFSIIFEKPFVVLANSERGLTRIESLLKQFGLEDRLVKDISLYGRKVLENSIDWENVRSLLANQKIESLRFLEESFKS